MLRKSVERVVKFTRDHKNTIIEVAAIASAGVKVYNFVKSKIDDERDRIKTKAMEDTINDLDGMRTYGYVEFKPIGLWPLLISSQINPSTIWNC